MTSQNDTTKQIHEIENQIELALKSLEMRGENAKALDIYLLAETQLNDLELNQDSPAYLEGQRVLAYCLMRQGNILRQMGETERALDLSEREIVAARASKDTIMLARSLMSSGTNRMVTGDLTRGLELLDQARALFEEGDSYDHQQGLGWYWILRADLANAGLIEQEPDEILKMAGHAIAILKPIENWPGVARAYAARVKVHEATGNEEAVTRDRKEQRHYESKTTLEENTT